MRAVHSKFSIALLFAPGLFRIAALLRLSAAALVAPCILFVELPSSIFHLRLPATADV